jgi:thymidine kinase
MAYGNVTVFTGPMFCGKSSNLIQTCIWKNHAKDYSLMIKPSFDDRYSTQEVVTHSGLKVTAQNVKHVNEIKHFFINDHYKNLMIDEVQFFEEPYVDGNLIPVIKEILKNGVNVFAAGLDMDWRGDPFIVTAKLLAMADNVHKLKAVCNWSGKEATKTFKKSFTGGSVELGETDKYEVRNNEFWRYE